MTEPVIVRFVGEPKMDRLTEAAKKFILIAEEVKKKKEEITNDHIS